MFNLLVSQQQSRPHKNTPTTKYASPLVATVIEFLGWKSGTVCEGPKGTHGRMFKKEATKSSTQASICLRLFSPVGFKGNLSPRHSKN